MDRTWGCLYSLLNSFIENHRKADPTTIFLRPLPPLVAPATRPLRESENSKSGPAGPRRGSGPGKPASSEPRTDSNSGLFVLLASHEIGEKRWALLKGELKWVRPFGKTNQASNGCMSFKGPFGGHGGDSCPATFGRLVAKWLMPSSEH